MQTLVDLSDLLTGSVAPGVYRWDEPMALVDVEQPLALAGWHLAHLGPVTGKADALASIAAALDFPDWFGGNYDALADCLRDVAAPTVLLWDGWAALAEADPVAFDVIGRILTGRADGTPAFAVLLRD